MSDHPGGGSNARSMGEAIGQVLPTAIGVAISPLPIVAVVLMLVTPAGRVNGPAFVLGWIVGWPSSAPSCCSSRAGPARTTTGRRRRG